MTASANTRAICIFAAALCINLISLVDATDREDAVTVLGSRDSQFTVNGESTFLLGISYYGGLGASENFIPQDLNDLQRHGFNWLRVWATWGAFENDVSAVDVSGGPLASFLAKLKWLVPECDRRGMIVDVTLTRRRRFDTSLCQPRPNGQGKLCGTGGTRNPDRWPGLSLGCRFAAELLSPVMRVADSRDLHLHRW